jgi:hypothetical protein
MEVCGGMGRAKMAGHAFGVFDKKILPGEGFVLK